MDWKKKLYIIKDKNMLVTESIAQVLQCFVPKFANDLNEI